MNTPETTLPLSDCVAECRRQQEVWARRPIGERLRPVRAFRRLLVTEADALCDAVARDLGKTQEETIAGDLLPLAEACLFLEREAPRLLRPRRVSLLRTPPWLWPQSDAVHRRPRGVVGVIGTWNYPLFLNGVSLMQALAAGNGVVWKPSEVAPASAAALFSLVVRAGFPTGLVQRLEATREAGQQLAEADVDHVAFIGSSTTGARLAETLGRRLVSSTLELSGVDAFFVLDDADPQFAARAAWFGVALNRGQTCVAVRRAFVDRSLYPAFTSALRRLVEAAAPMRMAMPAQVEQAERLVREAEAEGGKKVAGTPEKVPDTFSPTVIFDARPDMGLCREAIFAPVLAVLPFTSLEEALAMDAQCSYGLGASVITANPERAARLAAELRAGMVTINDVIAPTAHPGTPFGGVGKSGWGVTQGAEGLLEMTVPQVVTVKGTKFRPHFDLTTGKAGSQTDLVRGFLEAGHAPTIGRRLAGWFRVAGGLWTSVFKK